MDDKYLEELIALEPKSGAFATKEKPTIARKKIRLKETVHDILVATPGLARKILRESFPGHLGRPGQVGGSAPRDAGPSGDSPLKYNLGSLMRKSIPSIDSSGQLGLIGVPQKRVVSATQLGRDSKRNFLATAKIERADHLGGGVNETQIIDLAGGRASSDSDESFSKDAVFKPADGEAGGLREDIPSGEYYLREVAASKVADVLDIAEVPVVAEREIDGRVGSIHEYINNEFTPAKHLDDPMEYVEDASFISKAAIYDYLIGNEDRHLGNWLVNENDGSVVLIDHGLSFPESNEHAYIRSSFGYKAAEDGYRVRVPESWANKWPEIRKVLEECSISDDAIEATRNRFDDLMITMAREKKFGDLPLKITD